MVNALNMKLAYNRFDRCLARAGRVSLRVLAYLSVVVVSLTIPSALTKAQNIQFTQGSIGSGLENSVQVTIWTYPGRGATSLPVTLTYSSRVWRIGHLQTVNNQSFYQSIAEAIYAEYSTSGWKSSLDLPIVEWPKSDDTYYHYGGPYCSVCGSSSTQFRVKRVFIHMPDGSTHELRADDQPYSGSMIQTGTFYAVDGSRTRYDSSSATTGTLYLPDGTRYVLNGSSAQYIDRNGNTLNYDGSNHQWTDTLRRQITNPLPATPQAQDYSYTPPGFTSAYTFRWKNLADALTPVDGQTPSLKVAGTEYLPYPNQTPTNNAGNNFPQTNQSSENSLFHFDVPEDDESGSAYTLMVGRGQSQNQVFNPVVLAEIVLPNGLSYKFSYNIYGEIDKITYPTGAFEQVTYSALPPLGDVKAPYKQSNRGVTDRKLSADGQGDDFAESTYSSTGGLATSTAPDETGAPNGVRTETYRQNYATPMHIGAHGSISYFWPFGFEDARQGSTIEERVFAGGQNGAMFRRSLTQFSQTSNTVQPSLPQLDNTTKTAYRNARPTQTVSLILDTGGNALAKTVTHEYASNGFELTTGLDRTASNESYFGSVPQSTAQTGDIDSIQAAMQGQLPASRAETTYRSDSVYQTRNILGLPKLVVLKDGNGNIVSKSESFYDESAYSLLTYSDLTGSDYNDPGTTARGNVTTARRYIDVGAGTYLETHAQFDQCGNLRVATNERGIQSSIDYSNDSPTFYKHAFATQTTSAVPDSSGLHGSSTAFTSSSTFDLTTGLLLTTTDANGQVTTYSYSYIDDSNVTVTDPLNRLRQVTRPDGGWTKYSFGETLGNLYTKTESKFDASRTATTFQYVDPLGRATRSFSSEGGTSYIASDTIFDKLGRAWKVSNPYRTTTLNATPALNHTSDWTVSHFDTLGRVDFVTLPDSSIVHTDPQGIYTTVTDQAGRQRRQKTDALGRIVRVDEPNTSGSLGTVDAPTQPSFYQYNTQGNLIEISQGLSSSSSNPEDPQSYLQHRYFKYDALGRLTFEKQAEQAGTFTASDSLTGNSTWSRKLVYDESTYSGLLTTAYDARNISTQFSYDNLNRIYQVNYSDGTPAVNNYYDQAATNFFNKGHLTKASTAAVVADPAHGIEPVPATSQTYNYDLMGRVANNQQTVGDQSYAMSYDYNLGSAMTSETYPSGRVVSYAFDDGARLSQVSSGNTVYANQFDYSTTQGLLKSVTLGNGAVESYGYNSRLQMSSLDLTRSGTQIQHYDYKYGVYDPSTGALDESKNTGQIARIEGFIATNKQWQQNFEYDTLGRLKSGREFRGDNSAQSWLVNYDYDVFGNRYQYQSQNGGNPFSQVWVESGSFSSTTNRFISGVTYDDAGNVTVDSKFRNLSFQYDANNRQKQSANVNGSSPVVSVYDAAGQRVATQIAGSLTNVLVYDAGGKLLAEYGAPASGGTQYVFSDHQGSPRAVTGSGGNVISRHDYAPFGEELGAIGMRSSGQGYGNGDNARQKYADMESDDATGMDHTLWRQYDNLSGRWTAPDPYGGSMTPESPQSFNRYVYVNNDPINKVDPTGLMLSDIGVYQINDPEEAATLQRKSDADFRRGINADYAARHGGTVSYDKEGQASFIGKYSAVNYFRRMLAAPHVTVSATITGPASAIQVPTDLNDRAALAVILGEATSRGYLGTKQYNWSQSGSEAYGKPSGAIIEESTLYLEMQLMYSVLVNRSTDAKKRWPTTVEGNASSGEFLGYHKGKGIVDSGNFGSEGSATYEQARMAIDAINSGHQNGVYDKGIYYWKGVVQGRWIRPFTPADVYRTALTDFAYR
jgi:RHS repeat-associated protein